MTNETRYLKLKKDNGDGDGKKWLDVWFEQKQNGQKTHSTDALQMFSFGCLLIADNPSKVVK